jgi:DNA-directed RNA polymerase subunit RPC12/RpoP
MSAIFGKKNPVAPDARRPFQDEWGIFDPEQAGVSALARTSTDDQPAPPAVVAEVSAMPVEKPVVAKDTKPQAGKASAGALYTVESPVRCPQCEHEILTFRVLRVLRTQVSFTSTLPRKGYVIVCPDCQGLLSADLSGLV